METKVLLRHERLWQSIEAGKRSRRGTWTVIEKQTFSIERRLTAVALFRNGGGFISFQKIFNCRTLKEDRKVFYWIMNDRGRPIEARTQVRRGRADNTAWDKRFSIEPWTTVADLMELVKGSGRGRRTWPVWKTRVFYWAANGDSRHYAKAWLFWDITKTLKNGCYHTQDFNFLHYIKNKFWVRIILYTNAYYHRNFMVVITVSLILIKQSSQQCDYR